MKASEFDLLNIPEDERKAVLLQSGGLDSCYLACLLQYYDFEVEHLFIDYGQNSAKKEYESAQSIVKQYGGNLHKVDIDMPWLKDVCILNGGIATSRPDIKGTLGAVQSGVYVPMRNLLFIGIASSLAEACKIKYIATGIDGCQDREGNPIDGTTDKHPNFALQLEGALIEASSLHHLYGEDFELICPIISMPKISTVSRGIEIGCDFTDSWTCYNSTEKPCMKCDACLGRLDAFEFLRREDPAIVKYYGHYENAEKLFEKIGYPY